MDTHELADCHDIIDQDQYGHGHTYPDGDQHSIILCDILANPHFNEYSHSFNHEHGLYHIHSNGYTHPVLRRQCFRPQ